MTFHDILVGSYGPVKHSKPNTVDGRNPAPVDTVNIPLFAGIHTSQVVQEFFHQQYHEVVSQPKVNCWFVLVVWIPEIPLWKGLLLKGTLRIPNHQPKPTINHWLIDDKKPSTCWSPKISQQLHPPNTWMSRWKLGSMGSYHLADKWLVYWGERTPLIRSPLIHPLPSRDIQTLLVGGWTHPFEKILCGQIWSFPQVGVNIKAYLEHHHNSQSTYPHLRYPHEK